VLTDQQQELSSWSLPGWLLARFQHSNSTRRGRAGRFPRCAPRCCCLPRRSACRASDGRRKVWDTLGSGYLKELRPEARLLPDTECGARRIAGHLRRDALGFANLRSALPMNLHGHFPAFRIWAGTSRHRPITGIWREMPGDLWRTIPVRYATHDGRCHVCAGTTGS